MLPAVRDDIVTLPRVGVAARLTDPTGFWSLRAQAIAAAQAASGVMWTDYNLHDPGVTTIEAFCYALTSLVYAIDFPVADHLAGPRGIDWRRAGLVLPDAIFPCRATTAADLRAVVLDGDATLDDVRVVADHDRGVVVLSTAASPGATPDLALIRSAYAAQRGLGEDLDDAVAAIAPAIWVLTADLHVHGHRDPAAVTADVFAACERVLARPARDADRHERVRVGEPLPAILDGPLLRYHDRGASGRRSGELPLADLSQVILAIDDVTAIVDLRFEHERDGEVTAADDVVTWNAGEEVPVAAIPLPHYDPALQRWLCERIRLTQRGDAVVADPAEVVGRLASCSRARHLTRVADGRIVAPPEGSARATVPWRSIAHLFPPLYRLGHAAGDQENTAFASYLALFDGFLAEAAGRIDRLRERFSAAAQDPPRAVVGHAPCDGDAAMVPDAQRHAALDYLLALYGETLDLAAAARFLGYLDRQERDGALLALKARFLADIVDVGRNRAGGTDFDAPFLAPAERDGTAGFARRVALLIGFADPRARALAAGLGVERIDRGTGLRTLTAATIPLSLPEHATLPDGVTLATADIALADLLEHGVDARAFRWHHASRTLWLASARDRGWPVATCPDQHAAARTAAWLRRQLLELTRAGDGCHVVEHVLLRPRGGPADPAFTACRVTLVFPGWTRRTADPAFRDFAASTARRECPAHIALRCRWLDIAEMSAFEDRLAAWAALRQSADAGAIDAAAAAVERVVRPAWATA